MGETFGIIIAYTIFNFIGACLRWVSGTVWRTIMNKRKFTFKEYLNGPKNSSEYYDKMAHGQNNIWIGVIFFIIISTIIIKYNI